jgi:MOSC domain-containing protein YiiM
MSQEAAKEPRGHVASLHLHPAQAGKPLQTVSEITLEAGKGIVGEPRYFARVSNSTGKPTQRQVSLIEREQIAEHAATLGLPGIAPGVVRSNIETEGVELGQWLGREVQVGEAVLFFYDRRTPCEKMDAICQGLRAEMENGRQGVMAEVVKGGRVCADDAIVLCRKP